MEIDNKIESLRFGVAAAGVTLYGLTLNEWVAVVTLVYLAIQIFILTPRAWTLSCDLLRKLKKRFR